MRALTVLSAEELKQQQKQSRNRNNNNNKHNNKKQQQQQQPVEANRLVTWSQDNTVSLWALEKKETLVADKPLRKLVQLSTTTETLLQGVSPFTLRQYAGIHFAALTSKEGLITIRKLQLTDSKVVACALKSVKLDFHDDVVNNTQIQPLLSRLLPGRDAVCLSSYSRDMNIVLWNLTQPLLQLNTPSKLVKEQQATPMLVLTGHEAWIKGFKVINVTEPVVDEQKKTVDNNNNNNNNNNNDGQTKQEEEKKKKKRYGQKVPMLVSWSDDMKFKFWNVHKCKFFNPTDPEAPLTPTAVYTITEAHTEKILGFNTFFHKGTQYGISWSADCSMRVWDLDMIAGHLLVASQDQELPPPREAITAHSDWVSRVTTLKYLDRSFLVSWSRDGTILFWDLNAIVAEDVSAITPLLSLTEHFAPVKSFAYLGGDVAISTAEDKRLISYNLRVLLAEHLPLKHRPSEEELLSLVQYRVLFEHSDVIARVTPFANNSLLLCQDKSSLWVLEIQSKRIVWSLTFDAPLTQTLPFFTGGRAKTHITHLIAGHSDGTLSHVGVLNDAASVLHKTQ
jgi:WD40 repeat protein